MNEWCGIIVLSFLTGFLSGIVFSLFFDVKRQVREMKELNKKIAYYEGQIRKEG